MCRPRSTPTNSRGNLSEVGSEWGVSRMDAAAKPTRTYLRRPRTPTPPRHPTECQLLLLLLPWLEGFGGCRVQPCPTTFTSTGCPCCHAGCSRHAPVLRRHAPAGTPRTAGHRARPGAAPTGSARRIPSQCSRPGPSRSWRRAGDRIVDGGVDLVLDRAVSRPTGSHGHPPQVCRLIWRRYTPAKGTP